MALPKHNRMTRRDFTRFFKTGHRVRGKHCSIHYGPLSTEYSQVAVVVQAKAVPRAVERNKIRRVLFDSIGLLIPRFISTVFLVVIIHTRPSEKSLRDCQTELKEMLRKSGIIK